MRKASSYRGARRNAQLRGDVKGVWQGVKPTGRIYRAPVRLNRSQHWTAIRSYADSPSRKHLGGYSG